MVYRWLYLVFILVVIGVVYDIQQLKKQVRESQVYFLSEDSSSSSSVSDMETNGIYSRLLSIQASVKGLGEDEWKIKTLYEQTLEHFQKGRKEEGCEELMRLLDLDSSLKNQLPREIKKEFADFLKTLPESEKNSQNYARYLKIAKFYEQAEEIQQAILFYEKVQGKFLSPGLNGFVEEKIKILKENFIKGKTTNELD